MKPLNDMGSVFAGQRVPGGCPDCDAYQTFTQDTPGILMVLVHHDNTCPFYRRCTR